MNPSLPSRTTAALSSKSVRSSRDASNNAATAQVPPPYHVADTLAAPQSTHTDGEGLFNYMKAGCGPLVPALQVLCLLMLVGHCVWGGIVLGDSAVVKQLCGDGLADWTSNVLIVQALVYIAVAAIPFTMRNKHNARITGVVYLALAVAMFVLYLSKFAINVKLLSKATGQDLSCQAMRPWGGVLFRTLS